MSQSRLGSFMEAVTNSVVGYLIAMAITAGIWNGIFHRHISLGENFIAVGLFTIASIVRSYLLRRFFNWWSA